MENKMEMRETLNLIKETREKDLEEQKKIDEILERK